MTTSVAPAQYGPLSEVYDRWTVANRYDLWADYAAARFKPGGDVLDLCCGTGTLTALMRDRGYVVTGVDRSADMLAVARERLGGSAELVHADIRDLKLDASFDGALCTFDSINYLVRDGELERAFTAVAAALRPGGQFIFDVNTRHKLENVFGDSHYGDDLGDFAYVWRNFHDREERRTRFDITLFRQREDGGFDRFEETHAQRWFTHSEIRSAAARAGLRVADLTDDYGTAEILPTTCRETWTLLRP